MNPFRPFAPVAAAVVLATGLFAAPSLAAAQAAQSVRAQAPASNAAPIFIENQDARETREALMEVLKRYPPQFGYILKLDPTLMSNPAYLTPYPALAQFLQQHPEVARSPRFYFENVYNQSDWRPEEPATTEQSAIMMWRNIIEGFTFLLGFVSVVGAIAWIIKSVIEHRRWSRLAKVQAEVHNKLIDRLASNDEMLAYIQSPAGAGFLKGAPLPLGSSAQAMNAPFGRILWSAQAGVVLFALGIGLRWVTVSAPNEVTEMLRFLGIIGQALGLGFLVSSGLSYMMSRRMGLIDASTNRVERDTPSRS